MSRVPVYSFLLLAASAAVSLPAFGQAVISTHSGVIHFFEGSVSVSGQPLENRFGRFTLIPDGEDLRTDQGRAEVLLTPGVVLRLGERSAIRMVDTTLSDTKVEVLSGSAIVESAEPAPGTSVTVIYKNWNIHQAHAGVYRVDCDPPKLQVSQGAVQVAAVGGDASVTVQEGMDLPFEKILMPEAAAIKPSDAFTDWADGRAQSISADNAISADIQDPANMNGASFPVDAFTYYPLLGFPSPVSGLGSYGSLGLSPYSGLYGTSPIYQAGFFSVYLPGYTYRPMLLRLPMGIGLGHTLYPTSLPYSTHFGTLGPTRLALPPTTITRPPLTRPVTPPPAIAHPAVIHVGGK
jgi:hypothetical protein